VAILGVLLLLAGVLILVFGVLILVAQAYLASLTSLGLAVEGLTLTAAAIAIGVGLILTFAGIGLIRLRLWAWVLAFLGTVGGLILLVLYTTSLCGIAFAAVLFLYLILVRKEFR
jgi:hypothetical protein